MAEEDVTVRNLLLNNWVLLLFGSVGAVYIAKKFLPKVYDAAYAYIMWKLGLAMAKSKSITAIKAELFSNLSSLVPKEGLTIVEIGAGQGANFNFYPPKSSVICVEPKLAFESYLSAAIQNEGGHIHDVRFMEGVGENLCSLVSPESVDYVICTLVLCSVTDIRKVAAEVHTILRPVSIICLFSYPHRSAIYISSICIPPIDSLFIWGIQVLTECILMNHPWKR